MSAVLARPRSRQPTGTALVDPTQTRRIGTRAAEVDTDPDPGARLGCLPFAHACQRPAGSQEPIRPTHRFRWNRR